MTDSVKLGLVKELVENYYDMFSSLDDARNGIALDVVLSCINTIVWFEEKCETAQGTCETEAAKA